MINTSPRSRFTRAIVCSFAMRLHRAPIAAVLALMGACDGRSCSRSPPAGPPPMLLHHPVRLDDAGKILPWPGAGGYARVAELAWKALETRFQVQDNGLPTYLAYSRFDPDELLGVSWPHNPAGLYAMLTDSAVLWYAFSGDAAG